MSLKINTNSNQGFSTYQLQKGHQGLADSLKRISSGRQINAASDDASGMVIANRLATQARGYGQAIKNANDAVSITQVADGALGQAVEILQDIRVKVLQAANGSQSVESRQAIQADIGKGLESLSNIAGTTSFNGQKLLSGTFVDKQFQVGADSGETIELSLGSIAPETISNEGLGSLSSIDVTTEEGRGAALELTDLALEQVSKIRSEVGAKQNQLESSINTLSTSQIHAESAASQIMDVDFAEESMNLNRMKILQKARAFAFSQSNAMAEKVADLFK